MKIGIITDIHNNLVALESVLDYLKKEKCEKIICCGDIIGIGPYPDETVQRMMQIPDLIAVRGNHERYLIEGISSKMAEEDRIGEDEKQYHKWEHSMLSQSSKDFLYGLPYEKSIIVEGRKISIMHYAMDDDHKYINFDLNTDESDLKKIFKNVKSDIILYGHNHNRNICKSDKLYINVGSLGCPAGDKNIARFGILKITKDDVSVIPADIKYNADIVVDKINEYNFPAAGEIKAFFYGVK